METAYGSGRRLDVSPRVGAGRLELRATIGVYLPAALDRTLESRLQSNEPFSSTIQLQLNSAPNIARFRLFITDYLDRRVV